MLCVPIRIESPHQRDYNENTQNAIINMEDQKDSPKLSPCASVLGVMINPQGLELPMSRIKFMVPKMFEPSMFYCKTEDIWPWA